jgi:hypothetical protein
MNAPAKIYSFTDREVTHPGDPPGDRIDAQFDNHAAAITSLAQALATVRRSDGGLANGIVTEESLAPDLFADLTQNIISAAEDLAAQTEANAVAVAQAEIATAAFRDEAVQAAAAAVNAMEIVEGDRSIAMNALITLAGNATASFNAVVSARAAVDNSQNDAALAAAVAQDWAEASFAWAEHMPGTIPPNILATMGISGDHWSSRWWANYVDQKIAEWIPQYNQAIIDLDQFGDLYLGAKPSNPALDNDGDPLKAGALYWNTTNSTMYVWSGTQWVALATGGGEINTAENLGGGNGVFAQKVGPILQFKSLRHGTNFSVVSTATELQIALASVEWSKISQTPTTLAGYGIADAYTKAQIDASQAAQDASINTKASVSYVDAQNAAQNTQINLKADKTYVDAQDTTLANAIAAKADASTVNSANAAQDALIALKLDKTDTGTTGAAKIPAGTTAQQPASPAAGYLRFNTTTGKYEGHNGTAWAAIGGGASIGTTPPSNPGPGDLWWSSDLGVMFVYYNDGNSSQWVSASPAVDTSQFYAKAEADARFNGRGLFYAYGTNPVSVPNNADAKLTSVETNDDDNWYDAALSRYTPKIAGIYQISCAVQANVGGTSGGLTARIGKNGSIIEVASGPLTPPYMIPAGTTLMAMNGTTDYLEPFAYQNSGAAITIFLKHFHGFLVRAT